MGVGVKMKIWNGETTFDITDPDTGEMYRYELSVAMSRGMDLASITRDFDSEMPCFGAFGRDNDDALPALSRHLRKLADSVDRVHKRGVHAAPAGLTT